MRSKFLKISLSFAVLLSMFSSIFMPQLVSLKTMKSDSTNLALNKAVTYSGVEGGKKGDGWTYPQFVGEMAVDGITKDTSKRWSAENIKAGPEVYQQWLEVDLGKVYSLDSIAIDFHAETTDYSILTSVDKVNWDTITNVTDGTRGTTVSRSFDANKISARYVKYVQNKQWLHASNKNYYGTSIYEIEVYEATDAEISDNTLRVGTFNIAANKKPNVELQRELTDKYALEIVGLQEVDRNTGRNNYDMLDRFATNKYTSSYYSKAIDHDGGEYGIGTVSRYSLENATTTFVDTTGAEEARVFQRSVLQKNGKEIAFYNLHFSWESLEIREKQFQQLKTALAADPVAYKIVVGDFNADQYHSEFFTFMEDMDLTNGANNVWYDTFNGVDNTMLVNSVDNILVSRNLKVNSVQMVETTLSDHNLFTAEVEFLDETVVSYQYLQLLLQMYDQLDTSRYTKSSVVAFEEAYENAQNGLQQATTQADVNTLASNLLQAYKALEYTNLAYNKNVEYSGVEGDKNADGTWKYPKFMGEKAVDGIIGDKDKRWSGNKIDKAWLTVDLGEVKEISDVLIYFESAAPEYQILISKDGQTWDCVYEEKNGEHGAEGLVQASFDKTEARYVKYQQIKQWKHSSNGKYYSASIYELEVYEDIAIESITLENETDIISIGDTYALEAVITPSLASKKKVIYSSDDTSVAFIDDKGVITGVGEGTATITIASASNSQIYTTFTIEVVDGPIVVSKITLDEDELYLTSRDKRFANYSVYPSQAINPDLEVVWTSSDESIARVNKNGLIECQKVGTAIITVSSKENPAIQSSMKVVVEPTNYVADYDIMHDRWLRRVVGDETMDLSDKDVKAYVDNVSKEAIKLWDEMDKSEDRTYLWENTDSTVSADYTTQFTKIKKLALAFGMRGSELYQNKDLYNDIIRALDFMYHVKKYNGTYRTGNWWDWQIGCTHQLVDTLIILKDYARDGEIDLLISSVEGYAADPSKQIPNTTATGANRTDIGLAVLGSAIVAKNDDRMNLVLTKVPDVMKLVTKGDGLYADGSVVQHTAHAYTGSYGNELMKGIGKIQSITSGTQWEIVDERIENVYNTAVNGYIPLMERGRMMAMVNGRSIARAPGTNPFTTELASGSETVSNMMLIAQFAPTDVSNELYSSIKNWLEASNEQYDFFTNARDIESLLNAKSILESKEIESKRYTGMKVYGSMDRVVQAKDTYSVGLAMYSSRIYNYEYGNTENPRGWHLADGALYVYTNDFKQYGEGYWTTIDALRIPGTTTDTRNRNNGSDQGEKSAQSLVGGTTDGSNGTASMFLNKSHVANMDLKAKKSWFFLDGKVVAVGSDINGTSTNSIETTIENRVISDDSTISINGNVLTEKEKNLNLNESSYVHYDEKSTNTQIGYYFPNKQELYTKVEERTGKYSDINNYFVNDKTYTMDYFTLGMNHGDTVVNGSYEYVLFPDTSEKQIADYAETNELQIINEQNAHGIIEENVFAFNTFADNVEVNGYTVSEPACVYTNTERDRLKITISNPKQNAITLKLHVGDKYQYVISKDAKIEEVGNGDFTIDTTGAAGKSFTMELQLYPDTTALENEIALSEDVLSNSVNYIPSTIKDLATEVEIAKDVLVNGKTQDELDAATNRLKSIRELATVLANKDELKAVIEEIQSMDLEAYTSESIEKLQQELELASQVFDDVEATQKVVDETVVKLKDAVDSLVKKETETNPGEEKPDPEKPDPEKPGEKPEDKPDQNPSEAPTESTNDGVNSGDSTNVNGLYGVLLLATLSIIVFGSRKYKKMMKK